MVYLPLHYSSKIDQKARYLIIISRIWSIIICKTIHNQETNKSVAIFIIFKKINYILRGSFLCIICIIFLISRVYEWWRTLLCNLFWFYLFLNKKWVLVFSFFRVFRKLLELSLITIFMNILNYQSREILVSFRIFKY